MRLNAEKRLWLSWGTPTRIAFLRLCSNVRRWQTEADTDAGPAILSSLNAVPHEVAHAVMATPREIARSVRGDNLARMKRVQRGWRLPAYAIAGMGNANAARLFARGHEEGPGFFVSGRDLQESAAAVSTERLARFLARVEPLAEDWTEEYAEKHGLRDWMAYGVADDESEIILVSPVFRLFSQNEVDEGGSRNVRGV